MIDFDTILLGSDDAFAHGVSTFADSYPEWRDPLSRIYVKFRPEGIHESLSFLALLDTGGHYCILNESLIPSVRDRLVDSLGPVDLRTAHGPIRGELFLLRIELISEIGKDLDVETIAFISPSWEAPSYIG